MSIIPERERDEVVRAIIEARDRTLASMRAERERDREQLAKLEAIAAAMGVA